MYIRNEKRENIKIGTAEEYYSAEKTAESLEEFIDETLVELLDFNGCRDLKKYNITLETELSCIRAILEPTAGVSFCISISSYPGFNYFYASQHGETESMRKLRKSTGDGICGKNSIMHYRASVYPINAGYKDRNFSFDGEEKEDGSVINYVDGFLPNPRKKVVYHTQTEEYVAFRIGNHDYPQAEYKKVAPGKYDLVGYLNVDGTPAVVTPTIVTTYPSFDEGLTDMNAKIEAFKKVWNDALERLRQAQETPAVQYKKDQQ